MRVLSILVALGAMATMAAMAAAAEPTTRPGVRVLATGGTIAGTGSRGLASYRPGAVRVEDLLAAAPGLADRAAISAEQVANVGSYDIDEAIWRRLAARTKAAFADPSMAGVVITHGTDTIEETAFFLSLVLPTAKPVVLVGAMRPATALGADGPHNLEDAVKVASAPASRARGALVVMSDLIHSAKAVTKVHNHRLDAFASPEVGPVGDVAGAEPVFYRPAGAEAPAAFELRDAPLPRVPVLYAFAGLGGTEVRAAARGADGLILAGVGAGNFSASAQAAVKALTASGMPVVRVARQGAGDVWREDSGAGERSDDALGTVAGRALTPAKARILLMLALAGGIKASSLQATFDRFAAPGAP